MIQISLETLPSGLLRCTGRVDYRSVCVLEGEDSPGHGRGLVFRVLDTVAVAHRYGHEDFDFTHIQLNPEAIRAISQPAPVRQYYARVGADGRLRYL